jgi:ADP-heptose:LPS heptosyltransferase
MISGSQHDGKPRPPLLVLRALGLGDLLTAVPALRALARAFPEHRRILAAPRVLAPLVAQISVDPISPQRQQRPAIDVVADFPASVGGRTVAAADTALPLPYGAIAVNLHGRGPQSHRLLLAAYPRRLIAFASPIVPGPPQRPRWRDDEHEVSRWCRLLGDPGIAANAGELDLHLHRTEPTEDGPTLLHPGAASAARRWPVDRWAAVARGLRTRGHRVLVTGSADETALAHAVVVAAGLPADTVVAGRTTLLGLARLVATAGRVICGDTGVAHLATALQVPSVVLFGPTSPAVWGPPPERHRHRVLWSGSIGDPHGTAPDPGLLELEPADVIAAVDDLCTETSPAHHAVFSTAA